jgi:hypothetical protein
MAIEIKKGKPARVAALSEKQAAHSKYAEVYETIVVMPPDSHFAVPGTAGKKSKELIGVKAGITRFLRSRDLAGYSVGHLHEDDGGGLFVRRTAEVAETRPRPVAMSDAGAGGRLIPTPMAGSGRPLARRMPPGGGIAIANGAVNGVRDSE